MFKNVNELKNFIIWCKESKIKQFKNEDVSFELSELAYIPDNSEMKEIKLEDTKTLADISESMTPEEYEDLLFHSSN